MDEQDLLDLIAADDSPSQISDRIKEIISAKALEKVDALVPDVATSLFNGSDEE